jgi:hypothetical protein
MKKQIQFFFILIGCLAFNNAKAQVNYQWVKGIGSTATDIAKGIAVDGAGNIYVTGQFGGTADFNPFGSSVATLTKTGLFNCFVAKYGSDGNILWKNRVSPSGSNDFALGTGIDVDGSGNVYITGSFIGTIGFSLSATDSLTSVGVDGFFAKYNANGVFQWAKRFGGTDEDAVSAVVVDGPGTGVYISGYFKNANANFSNLIGTSDTVLINAGNKDIFIAKYGSDGSFKWAKGIGGSGEDIGAAIATDVFDTYVTITGSFQGSVDFNPGGSPETRIALGVKDAFFTKYLSDGSLGWAKNIGKSGSSNSAAGSGIAIYQSKVFLTGAFKGIIDFDPDGGTLDSTSIGLQDIFFAQYNLSDGALGWAHHIGSSFNIMTDSAISTAISTDTSGNIYLTGSFEGKANFNPLQGGDTLESTGDGDVFFAKYDEDGGKKWARSIGAEVTDVGYGITVDNSENVYLTGIFQKTVNFDPTGIAKRTSSGNFGEDIFIAKYSQGTSVITGSVTYIENGSPAPLNGNLNFAKLYTQTPNDGNAAMHLVETVEIDQSGIYTFNDVCKGSYILLATANASDYSFLASTYYPDTIHWNDAYIINITTDTIYVADIAMKKCTAPSAGPGTIGGTVKEGIGYNRNPGDPIPGTEVGLEGDPEGVMAKVVTDSLGNYTFENLATRCYTIYVNIPGLPMDTIYNVCPTNSDTVMNLNFIADSGSVYSDPTTTSVKQIASQQTKILIYPNPYKGVTSIEFTLLETNKVQIEIYNLLGEKVFELLNEQKQAGIVKCKFNAANAGLKAGIYLLNFKVGDDVSSKKIIQIE